MEISEIKQRLTLPMVLNHYGLKADKSHRISCPFHKDKTPSMQLYYKTQTAYCFSANCKTHGKAMDVIDFIMHKENISKHEAIEKAKSFLVNSEERIVNNEQSTSPITHHPSPMERTQFLSNMFTYFRNAISNSQPAKEYVKSRSLDIAKIEVGYNSGQFHHGARKDYGHTALRIDNTIYGYYPTGDMILSDGKLKAENIEVFREFEKNANIISYDVKVEPWQKGALKNNMKFYNKNPGNYSIFGRNCTSFAVDNLHSINVQIYNSSNCVIIRENGYRLTPNSLDSILQNRFNNSIFTNRNTFIVDKKTP